MKYTISDHFPNMSVFVILQKNGDNFPLARIVFKFNQKTKTTVCYFHISTFVCTVSEEFFSRHKAFRDAFEKFVNNNGIFVTKVQNNDDSLILEYRDVFEFFYENWKNYDEWDQNIYEKFNLISAL